VGDKGEGIREHARIGEDEIIRGGEGGRREGRWGRGGGWEEREVV
jgi:hypothetical protein